ncbi:rho GTPase-activating protein gacV-like [Mercenaria mercenaria]|uniref:rho GTPase-activating protein gacV-like n=1 Tax=Mercenaria mercenaria TaxID=6596 RepID=UPI00234F9566|nr:rho GTPase-activating protein gacV-like [Mercenaria mercenaria]
MVEDQIIAKDELKQRCDNEKEQMTNRLNSQQQQYKMLKSQHEDMETEFGRLQNEKEKENEEHKKQDEERAIEYNQFKQEKSLEIASLKDSVANLEREKEQLTQQMAELKLQLQGSLVGTALVAKEP